MPRRRLRRPLAKPPSLRVARNDHALPTCSAATACSVRTADGKNRRRQFGHLAELTGRSFAWMLGELTGPAAGHRVARGQRDLMGQDRGDLDRRIGDWQAPLDAQVRRVAPTRERDHRVRAGLRHQRYTVPGVVGRLAPRCARGLPSAPGPAHARRRTGSTGNCQRHL